MHSAKIFTQQMTFAVVGFLFSLMRLVVHFAEKSRNSGVTGERQAALIFNPAILYRAAASSMVGLLHYGTFQRLAIINLRPGAIIDGHLLADLLLV